MPPSRNDSQRSSSSQGSSQGRSDRAEARRQQIVDTALRLFAVNGFAATSTKSIAEAVGVTEGLIFHYFPTKAQLLSEVTAQRSTFMGEATALLEGAQERPAREVLGGIVLGWVDAIQRQADLVTTLLVESQTNAELAGVFRGVVGQVVGAMAAYLEARVAAGELRPDLPTRTSATVFFSSLMMFFLTHKELAPDAWSAQATAFTNEVLDTWFRGALAQPDQPS